MDQLLKKQDTKLLDAGMGFGQYSWYLANRYKSAEVFGVDVKEEQVEDCNLFFKACNRSNASFAIADLTKFNAPETYDFILSVDVMEHIEEDVKVFENFYAALKPSGTLLVSTPSDQGGSDAHDHEHEHDDSEVHGFIDEHVRDGYNIIEIEEKLTKAGFKDINARYAYGAPGKLAWRLSMKYPILMLNATKLSFIILPIYYLLTFWLCLILNKIDVNMNHKSGTGLIVLARK